MGRKGAPWVWHVLQSTWDTLWLILDKSSPVVELGPIQPPASWETCYLDHLPKKVMREGLLFSITRNIIQRKEGYFGNYKRLIQGLVVKSWFFCEKRQRGWGSGPPRTSSHWTKAICCSPHTLWVTSPTVPSTSWCSSERSWEVLGVPATGRHICPPGRGFFSKPGFAGITKSCFGQPIAPAAQHTLFFLLLFSVVLGF